MKKHFKFVSDLPFTGVIIVDFFKQHGFTIIREDFDQWFFSRRKNWMFYFFSRNPLNWSCQVIVLRRGEEVMAYMQIDTFAKRVTKNSEQILENFLSDFKIALNGS